MELNKLNGTAHLYMTESVANKGIVVGVKVLCSVIVARINGDFSS